MTATIRKLIWAGFLSSVFLLLPHFAGAQSRQPVERLARAAWPQFYSKLKAAVDRRDVKGVLRFMPSDFQDGGGGSTAKEWLTFIDANTKEGAWKDFQSSFRKGTKVNTNWKSRGVPTRVTRDNGYYFEFRKDKKWYFAGVMGD
jgi:hypothetical protein